LGGSAAVAVSIIKALNNHFNLELTQDEINQMAFESEKIAHGKPSGIDNTMATLGYPMIYRSGDKPLIEPLNINQPFSILVGFTPNEGLTAKTVSLVRDLWKNNTAVYEKVFDEIDSMVLQSIQAIQNNDFELLGHLMNMNHGLLNTLQVSTPELERLIMIARESGALGAKLTGGGGGGAMIALCEDTDTIQAAIESEGCETLVFEINNP